MFWWENVKKNRVDDSESNSFRNLHTEKILENNLRLLSGPSSGQCNELQPKKHPMIEQHINPAAWWSSRTKPPLCTTNRVVCQTTSCDLVYRGRRRIWREAPANQNTGQTCLERWRSRCTVQRGKVQGRRPESWRQRRYESCIQSSRVWKWRSWRWLLHRVQEERNRFCRRNIHQFNGIWIWKCTSLHPSVVEIQ